MNMGSPTDERCQLMFHLLELFIRWEILFSGIAHVLSHATKDENGSQAGRLCHFIFKGGVCPFMSRKMAP
jgi:hypothetical protein